MRYIFRLGSRVKDLALTRRADYLTGLSFRNEPFGRYYLALNVTMLEDNGFIVRPDGGQLMTNIMTGEPYIEPNSGEQLEFDEGHVSVWYPNQVYWYAWYQADLANKGKPDISEQLAFFAQAIVKGE